MAIARPSKYRAQRTECDGITFASKAECKRYQELKLLQKAGEISGLERQPKFVLSVDNGNYPDNGRGRTIDLGKYISDFKYYTRDGGTVIEEVKGFRVPLGEWKRT